MARVVRTDDRQVAAFRLARHHLDRRQLPSIEHITRDVCGVQAQVMSSAQLAIWSRNPGLRPDDVSGALWTRRTIVKTSCMRQTLHLISTEDYPLYIFALVRSRTEALRRVFARLKITPEEMHVMQQAVVDALSEGPATQRALVARAQPRASTRMKQWLRLVSSPFRPAIVEGLICYGPSRGAEVTLVRTDQWLGRMDAFDENEAKRELLRRFLSAYGPATPRDFVKWSGISVAEAKPVWNAVAGELLDVAVESASGPDTARWILARDARALSTAKLRDDGVRLLPAFDSFLLAHAATDHLLDPRFYKRVYRNQGWLSPVVLSGGRIVGVWSSRDEGRTRAVTVEPFGPLSKKIREGIGEEVGALSEYLNAPCRVLFGRD
jgi:hypothetical protein